MFPRFLATTLGKMVGGLGPGSQGKQFLRLTLAIFLFAFLSVLYFFIDVTSFGYVDLRKDPEMDTGKDLKKDLGEITLDVEMDFYHNTDLLEPSENVSHTARDGYLVWSPSCRIPDIDPWHESVRPLIQRNDPVVCSELPPLTRVVGRTLSIVREHVHLYAGNSEIKCCYREITRWDAQVFKNSADNIFSMGQCLPFKTSVFLTEQQQFIFVKCIVTKLWKSYEVYTNAHTVVSMRKDVEQKLSRNITPDGYKLSVLIVGIDSVSRLNAIRAMPKTVSFLHKTGWMEMKGYNKIEDNTFPNVMAILTGLNVTSLSNTCMITNKHPLDSCPIIWKDFSEQGYVTGYGEDEPNIGTFNFEKGGFFKTPVNYYLRPFMLAAEKYSKIKKKDGMNICLGPTLSTDYIYKYAADFVTTFRQYLYFGLFWMNSQSHNNINSVSAVDLRTYTFLKEITNKGVLNNTLVLFLSDHGMRFGKIRETYVGWLEERLPMNYIWVPEWFRKAHHQMYSNLMENGDKLTSPFDLHMTLRQLVSGERQANGTASCADCVSLLDEVPSDRSCRDAGITEHWCTCSEYRTLSTEGNSVRSMVKFVTNEINNLVEGGKNSTAKHTKCAKLTVKRVMTVRSKIYHRKLNYNEYEILFETLPGEALFEATVSHSGQFKLLGTVSRINSYGAQSKCMSDSILKKYCFCIT